MSTDPPGTIRETLANLAKKADLRCFSDQPVAEIVQCGEPIPRFGSVLSPRPVSEVICALGSASRPKVRIQPEAIGSFGHRSD